MAKSKKVQSDDECDSESDDDEEYSKKVLMDMMQQAHECLELKRKECKDSQEIKIS